MISVGAGGTHEAGHFNELLAPESIEFSCKNGQRLGYNNSLEHHIRDVTRIPAQAL